MASIEQGGNVNLSPILTGVNINPYSVIGNGAQTVTTAGTSVQLASSTSIKTVTIRAKVSNTGLIYVGSSSVSSVNGFQLSPAETVSLDLDNLSKIYVDAASNGDGVTYVYLS